MSTGFDRPVRNVENKDGNASISIEASSLVRPASTRLPATEPDVLEFDSPFKSRGDTTMVAQAAPSSSSFKNPDWALPRPVWELYQQNPKPPDRQNQGQPPPRDQRIPPNREQQLPPQRDRQISPRDDTQRDGSTHVRVGADKFRLSERMDARVMSKVPDALVYVNPGFDTSKPVNLIVYNHGWADTITSSFNNARLREQMREAPANSILVVPSWQLHDGASSGAQNPKFKTNFTGLLDATMKASGKTLGDIKDITFVSHSAGYNAINRELNALRNTPLYDRIRTIANFDTNYEGQPATDEWIEHNIRNGNFRNGRASFMNIWVPGDTSGNSQAQSSRTMDLAQRFNIGPLVHSDFGDRRRSAVRRDQLGNKPIIFQRVNDEHGDLPKKFFGFAISRTR